MTRVVFILGIAIFGAACSDARTLPDLEPFDEIQVRLPTDASITIEDTDRVDRFHALIKSFRDGWRVPMFGPPVASVNITIIADGRVVGDFGVSDSFFTRTAGNFYSRAATADEVAQVRAVLGLDAVATDTR